MLKKALITIIAVILALGLASCGGADTNTSAEGTRETADISTENIDENDTAEESEVAGEKAELLYNLLDGAFLYYDEQLGFGELYKFHEGSLEYLHFMQSDRNKDKVSTGTYTVNY